MTPSTATSTPDRALASAYSFEHMLRSMTSRAQCEYSNAPLPLTSRTRLNASLSETPYDLHDYLAQAESKRGTVLYLAYGSNLSNETFRGKRGIKPLSQTNVQVPSLRLTFDLPGIPYTEPCFANSGKRDPENDPPGKDGSIDSENEKTPLLAVKAQRQDYIKDRWHKGLIGVVYEVTAQDYAHIIATEGGGSSYHDILVDCHAFASPDLSAPVPQNPILPPFKAHTLFAPATPSGEEPPKDGGRFSRPDTGYAQPSARYLKLITDGAAECGLPYEYQDYLHSLRPYTITSAKQRIGQFVYVSIWVPFVFLVFAMGRMFRDEKGRNPQWLTQLTGAIFTAAWASYDSFFEPMFGDGERSIPDGGHDAPTDDASTIRTARRLERRRTEPDIEKAELQKLMAR